MHDFAPIAVSSAESVLLAAGCESSFTGVTIVIGAETSEISVCRLGVELASRTLAVGSNWVDTEMARQFQIRVWDDAGDCYLDIESVREWKHQERVHLRNSVGEREKTLSRLYGSILNQIATTVRDLIKSPQVVAGLGRERLSVMCAGGATHIGGFATALTDHFVDHDIASAVLNVQTIADPANAVVRGLLIFGELEQRKRALEKAAA
jgi:Tfp pilus assembly PilM family ATPase